MGIAKVQFGSKAIGQQVEYNVILPETGEGPFPVLLQLHGLSDNQASWIQRSNLVRHVERYPFIVVLPNGGTSGYVNWPSPERMGKQNYEDLLMQDIPAHLGRHFNVLPGPWAIGGLSMGGYGSMRLGLKYPEKFASIWSHSSAFHIDDLIDDRFVIDRDDLDIFKLATALARSPVKPVIAFDCGIDDKNLIAGNRALHARMESIGLEHHYAEHPGAHTWDYWDDHVREALVQHARVFGVAQTPE